MFVPLEVLHEVHKTFEKSSYKVRTRNDHDLQRERSRQWNFSEKSSFGRDVNRKICLHQTFWFKLFELFESSSSSSLNKTIQIKDHSDQAVRTKLHTNYSQTSSLIKPIPSDSKKRKPRFIANISGNYLAGFWIHLGWPLKCSVWIPFGCFSFDASWMRLDVIHLK